MAPYLVVRSEPTKLLELELVEQEGISTSVITGTDMMGIKSHLGPNLASIEVNVTVVLVLTTSP